ncbi:MAG: hypothetical protein KatS3mg079_677 [Caloramator sp.]|nr:MAG: hypothetical protein KatS3mg079_677 [Caloramator sp.]
MIVTLEEAKHHLRIDTEDDDAYIQILINAAEQFIYNITGKTFDENNSLAKTVCLLLIADLYEKRELTTDKTSEKVRDIVTMILTQLALSGDTV